MTRPPSSDAEFAALLWEDANYRPRAQRPAARAAVVSMLRGSTGRDFDRERARYRAERRRQQARQRAQRERSKISARLTEHGGSLPSSYIDGPLTAEGLMMLDSHRLHERAAAYARVIACQTALALGRPGTVSPAPADDLAALLATLAARERPTRRPGKPSTTRNIARALRAAPRAPSCKGQHARA